MPKKYGRQGTVGAAVDSIFGDLARIAMSNNAAQRENELNAQKGLINLEINSLAKKISEQKPH